MQGIHRPRWWWGGDREAVRSRNTGVPRPRLRLGVEQLEDRTTPSLLGTPTPLVSLQGFSASNGHLTADLLFTLPGGTQQMAPTSVAITSLQRMHNGCPILNLTLDRVHLDVAGLVVDLQPLTIKVQAIPGRGQLLGNLLCNPALRGQRLLNTIAGELNTLLSASNLLGNLTVPASPLGSNAPLNVQQLSSDLNSAGIKPGSTSCKILSLDTGAIDLNLLGLDVSIPTGIHLTVTAVPSSQMGGGVLGDLLCQLSMALDNPSAVAGKLTAADLSNIIASLANPLGTGLPNLGAISLAGLGRGALNSAGPANAATGAHHICNVLSLTADQIKLDLLGLQVTTSPICLKIQAQRGPGNLLGNLLCGPDVTLRNVLQSLGSLLNTVGSLENALAGENASGLLANSSILQDLINQLAANLSSTSNPTTSCPVLNLTLGPLNLDLLGLLITLNNCANGPVTVNVTAMPGMGNLLGNLLCDLAAQA